MLLDDILTRLVKLEGKLESVGNASSANTSQPAGGVILSSAATAALHKPLKPEVAAGSRAGPMSRLHKHVLQRPHQ